MPGRDLWAWLHIDPRSGAILARARRGDLKAIRQGWLLSTAERALGYLRPLRFSYTHLVCGRDTVMSRGSAELWAKEPFKLKSTFCVHCHRDFPVGNRGQFVWLGSNERVGT